MMRHILFFVVLGAACRAHAPVPAIPPAPPATPPAAPPPAPPPPLAPPPPAPQELGLGGLPTSRRTATGPLTASERDSLLREAAVRRVAWQARGIVSYRLQVAVGCFCPWPGGPAIVEVKSGKVVALRDTTGKSMGQPREPWSLYTVEGLFDVVEEGARRDDVIEVIYDATYGYPTWIHGDMKVGLPDDWFYVRATRLTKF